jgi:hypothetical protein
MEVGLVADGLNKPVYGSRSHTICNSLSFVQSNRDMNYACEDGTGVNAHFYPSMLYD